MTRSSKVGVVLEPTDGGSVPATPIIANKAMPSVTVRGPIGELVLFVYGRQDKTDVELLGNDDDIARGQGRLVRHLTRDWRDRAVPERAESEDGYSSAVNADDLLRLVESEPRVTYEPGEALISVGDPHHPVFVLAIGALQRRARRSRARPLRRTRQHRRRDRPAARHARHPPTSIAVERSVVHRVDDAERLFDEKPEFARFIAQVLARRLSRVTSYIDDVYRQFEQHGGTLGLVPKVLDDLLGSHRPDVDAGSEREPDSP